MTIEQRTILTPSLFIFAHELQAAVQDGWEIDPNMPPTTFGICYECGMLRGDIVTQDSVNVLSSTKAKPKTTKNYVKPLQQ